MHLYSNILVIIRLYHKSFLAMQPDYGKLFPKKQSIEPLY